MFTWILGHFLATGIGISLGLIGGGGSVLALPILVYV
ncbi:sulfite exporter TauE/SafE family protein, partial [Dolichospermum sp. ST_sed5]|nr:sulfite exporter TauE/SafE family protein [Dolichospermum sp. ST_sed5]